MRKYARSAYESAHTPEKNYGRLMEIYEGVIRGDLFKQPAAAA
jgi:hypothetical protein